MSYKTSLPWLTGQLRNQTKEKNAMHIQVLLNPSDQLVNLKYKKTRNELTSTLKNTELNYFSDELELNKSDYVIKSGEY